MQGMKILLRNQSLARRACPLCWERVEGALSAQRSCGACEATYHRACVQEMIRGSSCPTMGCGGPLRGEVELRSRSARQECGTCGVAEGATRRCPSCLARYHWSPLCSSGECECGRPWNPLWSHEEQLPNPPMIRVRSRTSPELREGTSSEPRVEEAPRPVCSGHLCAATVSPALERLLWPMVLCGECSGRLLAVLVSLLVSVLILAAAC